jgi:hypothetical protein
VKHGVGKLFGKGKDNMKKAEVLSRELQGGFLPFLIPVVANAIMDNLGVGKGKGGMSFIHPGHPLLRHMVGPTDQGRRKGRGGAEILHTGVPLGEDFSGGMGWGSDMFADYKPGDITRGILGKPRKDKFKPSQLKPVKGSDRVKTAVEEAQEMYDEMISGKGRHTGGKRVKSAARSAAAKARAKTNPWLAHVKAVRAENPGVAYKDVLKLAKQSY